MGQHAIVSVLLLAVAQTAMAREPVRITAHGTKPMKDICEQISNLFHWRITYEDAPVLDMREVVQEKAPSGVPWLQMRAVPVEFDVPPMLEESVADYRRKVMSAAVNAYAHSGNRATFHYTDDGDYIHVVPAAVAGPDGRLRPTRSILDQPITIALGKYTIRALIETVLAQIGNRAGTTVSLGTVPNSFNQITLTEEVDNESARDFLIRVFERGNSARFAAGAPPERFLWRLNYSADGPQYFFNMGVVPAELDARTTAKRSLKSDIRTDPPNSAIDPGMKGTWAGHAIAPGTSTDQTKH